MRAQHCPVAKDRQQFLPHEQVLRGPDASVNRHKVSALLCANPKPHASAGQLLDLPNVGRKVFRHSYAFQHLHGLPRSCSGYGTIETQLPILATENTGFGKTLTFQASTKYRIQSCDLPRTTRPAAGTMPSLSPVNLITNPARSRVLPRGHAPVPPVGASLAGAGINVWSRQHRPFHHTTGQRAMNPRNHILKKPNGQFVAPTTHKACLQPE